MENPFLRSNPFHLPNHFYSSDNSTKYHNTKSCLELSTNYSNPFLDRKANRNPNPIKDKQLKKKANPFERKNLIRCLYVQENDNVESLPVPPFEKPQFLRSALKIQKESMPPGNFQSMEHNLYQRLSMSNLKSPQRLQKIQKNQTPTYKGMISHNLITSQKKYPLQEIGSNRQTFSHRSSSCNSSRANSGKQINLNLQVNDGKPSKIKVRNLTYYRNLVHRIW